jgi:thymidine kinase
MESVYPHGYLELAIGPMFSGKTSWILQKYQQHMYCDNKVVVINHAEDVRYDSTMLSTHDKKMIPCIQLTDFNEKSLDTTVTNNIITADVILINEGQFFTGLFHFVNMLLEKKKIIYICGLDGDFKQKKFGELLDLIPICDKVYKLRSLCSLCKNGTRAIFSHRVNKVIEQKLIGSDMYIPLCRKCYNDKNVDSTCTKIKLT